MSDVKRFIPGDGCTNVGEMTDIQTIVPRGGRPVVEPYDVLYVLASDYDALSQRVAELEREKAAALGLQQGTALVVEQLQERLNQANWLIDNVTLRDYNPERKAIWDDVRRIYQNSEQPHAGTGGRTDLADVVAEVGESIPNTVREMGLPATPEPDGTYKWIESAPPPDADAESQS